MKKILYRRHIKKTKKFLFRFNILFDGCHYNNVITRFSCNILINNKNNNTIFSLQKYIAAGPRWEEWCFFLLFRSS